MSKVDLEDVRRQITALMAAPATQQAHTDKLRALSSKKRKAAEQTVGPGLARAALDITTLREKLAQNERTFRDELKHLRIPQAETRAARKVGMVVPPKAVARRPHTGWNYAGRCEQRFFSVEQSFLQLTLRDFKEHCFRALYLSFPLF